jgi:hypothetical protein
VWLYFRFPLGLRMVEELLAARGIIVSHETVRQWARKFVGDHAVIAERSRFGGDNDFAARAFNFSRGADAATSQMTREMLAAT